MPQTTTLPALLEDGSDRSFREMAELSWLCAQRMAAINGLHASQVGLTPSQYTIVMTIAYLNEPIAVSALAERLGLSQPFVTREVGLLAKAGLVAKGGNPNDGRSTLISLTEQGRVASVELGGRLRETNDILFEKVNHGQFRFLKSFAESVAKQAELALYVAQHQYRQAGSGPPNVRKPRIRAPRPPVA